MTTNNNYTFFQSLILLLAVVLNSGCTTLDGPANPNDPLESFNRSMFTFNDTVDDYAFKPISKGYNFIMPDFASKGVSNFYSNVDDIVVFSNQLLQFKIHAALVTSARFIFNSTFGLLGLIDVATYMDLPKQNEDFGQTLAVWGVPSGAYVVLPLIGPRTIRDSFGLAVDWTLFDPIFNRQTLSQSLVNLSIKYIDTRAGLLRASSILDDTVPDRYAYVRDAWLLRREFLIYDGNPPLDDTFSDDELFGDEDLFDDDLNEDPADSIEPDNGQLPDKKSSGESTIENTRLKEKVLDKKILQQPAIQNNMEITIKGNKPSGSTGNNTDSTE